VFDVDAASDVACAGARWCGENGDERSVDCERDESEHRRDAAIRGRDDQYLGVGIYFKSNHTLTVGQSIELFFTLPTELTERSPEDVKCQARVADVDEGVDPYGRTGIGATIKRFEPATRWNRNWDN